MERFKGILKKIFLLPPLPTLFAAILGFGSVISVAAFRIQDPAFCYASYLASAYALAVTVTGLPHLGRALVRLRGALAGWYPVRRLRSTALGRRYMSDIHFRNRVSLHLGLTVNLAYIIMKLAAGIYYRSAWFISLAAYYLLLALTRVSLLRHRPGDDTASEFRRYRLCGFVLLIMNQALAGIVVFMVHQNRHFSYPGLLIYAMAAYSFYAVITAAVNVVRTRRHRSPILSATRAVNLVAALVSILSLTTAMLARFGENDSPEFRRAMTASVGGVICVFVIIMAAYMIWRTDRNLKNTGEHDVR